jgi:hypothetical protein
VDADEALIHADVALKPSGGAATAAVASMRPGDAAPLAGALDGPLALLFRDDAAGRAQTASAFEAALDKALGARLAEPDTKRVHGAIDAWTKARGDWMVLGLLGIDGLYLVTPTANEAAMDKAIKDAADLAKSAPVKDALRLRDVKWAGPREAEIGYGEKKTASLKWSTAEGRAKITLTSGASDAKTLGEDTKIAAALKGLGAGVTFAAVVQPLKLDPNKALLPAAPLVLGWGTKDGRIWAHADVADPLVHELAKSRMGF